MIKRLLLGLVMLSFACSAAWAEPTIINFSYIEPTTNTDGTPCTDLEFTTLYWTLNGAIPDSGLVLRALATSPGGGGTVSGSLTLEVPPGVVSTIELWATGTDKSMNESEDTPHVTTTRDFLAPSAPSNLTAD